LVAFELGGPGAYGGEESIPPAGEFVVLSCLRGRARLDCARRAVSGLAQRQPLGTDSREDPIGLGDLLGRDFVAAPNSAFSF
jgi:hypothetical protein